MTVIRLILFGVSLLNINEGPPVMHAKHIPLQTLTVL